MAKIKDLSGVKFGRLTALFIAGRNLKGKVLWECSCSCGSLKIATRDNLTSKRTKSCGCLVKESQIVNGKATIKHGMSSAPEYKTWQSMKDRCLNKKSKDYPKYGGRGISIWPKWLSFEGFYNDMGSRPDGCSIDRINNDKGYHPSNCRWATPKQQSTNRGVSLNPEVIKIIKSIAKTDNIEFHVAYKRFVRAVKIYIKKESK